ncbi:hypothetical protein MMC30_006775 [Trapelia coarctata]|nr:hypothetical protein [Trapelia coarctata]
MLGRFRMNVADCLLEYETLAEEVFGKPRIFFTLRFIFGNRTKYKAENLQRVIQNVAKRRAEHRSDNLVKTKLPYKRGLCKTFVTSLMTESNKKNAATLYLIRSYDHFPRISQPHGRRNLSEQPNRSVGPSAMPPSRVGTGFSSQSATEEERMAKATRRINYGSAQDFEVWQVARAATAAPLYFEELKIQDSSSNDLIFTDGGFNSTNNPAKEGSREIEEAHGPGRIGAVVSIGTARHDKAPDGKGLFPIRSRIEGIAQALSDPEVVHEDMETMSKEKKFPYYRLNNPGALDIPLDEWIPKRSSKRVGSEKKSGSRTMQTMSNSFDTWAKKHGTILLFKSCAEELVRRRRARISDPPRWERYASGAIYKCRYLECDLDEFTNGNEFRLHLIDRHELPESDLAGEIKHCRSSWEYQAQTGNGTR